MTLLRPDRSRRRRSICPSRAGLVFRGSLGIAIEVFADEGSAVAGVLKPGCDCRLFIAEAVKRREAAVVTAVAEDSMVVGILSTED